MAVRVALISALKMMMRVLFRVIHIHAVPPAAPERASEAGLPSLILPACPRTHFRDLHRKVDSDFVFGERASDGQQNTMDHNHHNQLTYATTILNLCYKVISALLLSILPVISQREIVGEQLFVVNAAKKQFYFRAEDPERKTNYGQRGQGNHHGPADQTGRQKNPLYEFKIARSARAQTKRGHKT